MDLEAFFKCHGVQRNNDREEGQEVKAVLNLGHYETPKVLPEPWQAYGWVDDGHKLMLVSGGTVEVKPIQRSEIFTKCIKGVSQVDGSE